MFWVHHTTEGLGHGMRARLGLRAALQRALCEAVLQFCGEVPWLRGRDSDAAAFRYIAMPLPAATCQAGRAG